MTTKLQQAVPDTARRVLIVALDAATPVVAPGANVLVVAPAINSRLRHWLSDEDVARRRAQERAASLVERLARSGVRAESRVGDADPLLAIADALATFPADVIVIAARPERTGLTHDLASRAQARFARPVFSAAESLSMAA